MAAAVATATGVPLAKFLTYQHASQQFNESLSPNTTRKREFPTEYKDSIIQGISKSARNMIYATSTAVAGFAKTADSHRAIFDGMAAATRVVAAESRDIDTTRNIFKGMAAGLAAAAIALPDDPTKDEDNDSNATQPLAEEEDTDTELDEAVAALPIPRNNDATSTSPSPSASPLLRVQPQYAASASGPMTSEEAATLARKPFVLLSAEDRVCACTTTFAAAPLAAGNNDPNGEEINQ